MNRIENLEIDPHIYDKGAKSNLMEKREYFQQMVLDKLNIHNTKKKKNEPQPKPHILYKN